MPNWIIGNTTNITWTPIDVLSDVQIDLSRNNGNSWETVVADTTNSGSYR